MNRPALLAIAAGVWLAIGAGLLVGALGSARAQPPRTREVNERLLADELVRDEPRRLREMIRGESGTDPTSPAGKALIEKAAKWYTHRLTWVEHQESVAEGAVRKPLNVMQEAFEQILDPLRLPQGQTQLNKIQQAYMDEMAKQMVVHLQDVLNNRRVIARVNAGRLLARLAEAGREEAIDVCLEILKDAEQHPAVKLYALRALKEWFDLTHRPNPVVHKREKETACTLALIDFLSRSPELPADLSLPEAQALLWVRREGVRALALTRSPAVVNKEKKIEGPTALVLLRYLRKDGIKPEPRLDEQLEAAIGICRMQTKLFVDYQADYALHHVGHFIVDWVTAYDADRQTNDAKSRLWRVEAERLNQALRDLAVVNAAAKQLHDRVDPILKDVAGRRVANPTPLKTWLEQNPPKNTTVYKGVADAKVREPDLGEN
jgi:hypothetical protein